MLLNVKFLQEKKLIGEYFNQVYQDTGKYCFGVDDTMKALDLGAVEKLICWEYLDVIRYVMRNTATKEIVIKLLRADQLSDQAHFVDKETSMLSDVICDVQMSS